jgi:N-acylneuraminate cytidylyltransferase
MRLAVIPARGGSKRIPRKNIKPFAGKPIIGYSVEVAIQSGCFDKVIVSTDDPEIAETARTFGAEVPFLRPPELSGDMTGTIDVISHAIREVAQDGVPPTQVCCIYATAPFIGVQDIQKALDLLVTSGADYCFPIAAFPAPIQRALKLSDKAEISMFTPQARDSRSQDLDQAYHDAGQFYWGNATAWLEHRPVFATSSRGLELPSYRVQDIDTPDDWIKAEMMFEALKNRNLGQ